MFFYVSKLLGLLWPSNLIAVLITIGVVLLLARRFEVLGKRMLLSGGLMLIVCGISPLGFGLILPLEERFGRGELPAKVDGIIILGGFESTTLTEARKDLALNDAADRLMAGIRLAFRHPEAKVMFAGGDGSVLAPGAGAAGEVGKLLLDIGFDNSRIVLESKSRTTAENASNLHALVKPRPDQRFVLVTSAFHTPRAVGTFRKAGFGVIAWPVDHRTRGPADALQFPSNLMQGLSLVDMALKEWLGLVGYRLSGRTDSLWPAP